ncbi:MULTISPECIES: FAD-dependent oxidoreductase [Halomonadaceae]|uniref:FAD-dependent oxidoreductase n=1 Tax=Halomonadaceae TaxID=28256 RepID=UPI00159904C3|nr:MULTISPECIES: FAD-dependent oxidoreductase [Halomonas]QJQ96541.1 FAD-dependent oxidoreductase [Halomonas sp. PA5]
MKSIWKEGLNNPGDYPTLTESIEADVVVIGAGITGLTVAQQLAHPGKRVVVLEARSVGGGCTGGSTGNLYSTLASGLSSIRKKWDDEAIRDVVESRAEAIDHIEATVAQFGIDCQFQRRPLYRLLTDVDSQSMESLESEREAMTQAGLHVMTEETPPLPFPVTRGLRLDNQAQFNAFHYVQGLARALGGLGVTLYEHSPVRDIDYKRGIVETDGGRVIAKHIVHATHTPKGVNLLQTEMIASREYAVSARLNDGSYPEGICFMLDPFHSLRSYQHQGDTYVMAIGEKHQTGEGQPESDHYQQLRAYLTTHFNVKEIEYQWSAQQYSSADGLPYIGRAHINDHTYVATGFSADGLTWGVLAGMVIGDLIRGRDNPWHQRFDARRFTPLKSATQWAKENVSVAKHFAKDYLSAEKLKALDGIVPGQATVATIDGEKLAIHRNEAGEFSVLSAVCPHMKCLVHWNEAETSWDCPCHGSRFDTQGEVIEGPSYSPLEKRHSS